MTPPAGPLIEGSCMTKPIVATSRRVFSILFAALRVAGTAFAAVAAAQAFAQGALREGVNYTVVKPPRPSASSHSAWGS